MSQRKSLRTKKTKNLWTVGVFAALLIGLLATVIAVQQSQDIRDRAAETAVAELSFVASTNPMPANSTGTIAVKLNTKGEPIDGVQVVVTVTGGGMSDITLNPQIPTGMKVVWQEKKAITGGFQISLALVNQTVTQPFANTSAQDIAQLSFIPKTNGDITITPNQSKTAVIKYQAATNILFAPSTMTVTVTGGTTGGSPATASAAPTSCPSIVPRPGNTGNFVGGIWEFIKTLVGNIAYLFTINTAQFPPELPRACGQITGESCRAVDTCTQGCPIGFGQTVGRCGGNERCCKPL